VDDPQKAVDFIRDNAPAYAKAKAERAYLDQFRKSKKSLLMLASDKKTVAEREADAYADDEYIELLNAYRDSVEEEERLKWQMIAEQARVEIWRTNSANNRMIDSASR